MFVCSHEKKLTANERTNAMDKRGRSPDFDEAMRTATTSGVFFAVPVQPPNKRPHLEQQQQLQPSFLAPMPVPPQVAMGRPNTVTEFL